MGKMKKKIFKVKEENIENECLRRSQRVIQAEETIDKLKNERKSMFSKEGQAKINETIAKVQEEAQKEKSEIDKLKKDIQQEKIKENLRNELEKFKNVKEELESKISHIMKE